MEYGDEGEGKEAKMATAQRGRSRSSAFAYSSDRSDTKIYIYILTRVLPSTAERKGITQNWKLSIVVDSNRDHV